MTDDILTIRTIKEPGDVLFVLARLCDDDQVDDVAEDLAQTHFAFLARAASFPALHEYNRASIVQVLSDHWTNDRPAARDALVDALDDPRGLVQECAFKGLMRFYRSGDASVKTLLDTRPLSSYLPTVRPTVQNLLSRPEFTPGQRVDLTGPAVDGRKHILETWGTVREVNAGNTYEVEFPGMHSLYTFPASSLKAYVPAPPVLEPRLKKLARDLTSACETLLELPYTASSNETDTARTECRWALDSLNAYLRGAS